MALLSAFSTYLKENPAMLIVLAIAVAFSALLFWAVSVLPLEKWAHTLGVKLRLVALDKDNTDTSAGAKKETTTDADETDNGADNTTASAGAETNNAGADETTASAGADETANH